jgi:hypothetical protein
MRLEIIIVVEYFSPGRSKLTKMRRLYRKVGAGMNLRSGLLFMLVTMMCACTAMEKKDWAVAGGSKADGTVILGIDVPPKMGVSETIVEWDAAQANSEADRRCRNWGYAGAEAFNDKLPVQVTCRPQGISPCWSKTYRIAYQCVDKK